MLEKFFADYYAMYGEKWSKKSIILLLKNRELRYIFYGRISIESKFILIKNFFRMLRHHMANKLNTEISFENTGEGFELAHGYSITITAKAVIGKNVSIRKGVTIGVEARGNRKGAPIIGNKVWIGPSASIVGNIKIGDDVLVAPNTYINKDVPAHSIVFGNPCKIVRKNKGMATEDYIKFYVENLEKRSH